MIKFIFLFLIIGVIIFHMLGTFKNIENYTNFSLNNSLFPESQTTILVQDTYPPIGKNQISDNTSNDIWWHYPTFQLGSYKQITNNIRFPNNPDEGRCMPASMCGALYHEKKLHSNYIKNLPPVNNNNGTRVGYFDTYINLLPFRTDNTNILY